MLRLKLYEFREGNLILISSPEFLVANKDTAAVELSADRPAEDGAPYRFELTPIRNESVL